MWKTKGLNYDLPELPDYTGQRRGKPGKTKSLFEYQICGADTETLHGCADLFSWESPVRTPEGTHFESHVEQVDTLYDVLICCISSGHYWRKSKRNGWTVPQFFFYNLKFDAQAILKLLSIRAIHEIMEEGEVTVNAMTGDFLPINGPMVKMSYLEGKAITFTMKDWKIKGAKVSRIQWWDISQYYGRLRLQDASTKYLGEGKQEICFDGTELQAWRFDESDYYSYYQDDIRSYAKLDAELTGRLARLKRDDFVKNGVRFIEPYSVANTAQRNLLDMGHFPTMNIFLNEESGRTITSAFMAAFDGGHFEVSSVGYIPDCVAKDLTSAYPYVMYHLPAFSVYNRKANREDLKGHWFWGEGEEWNEAIEGQPYGSLGVVEVAITFEKGLEWYPLVMKAPSQTLVSPRRFSGWITLAEYEEAIQWPIESIQIGRWILHCDSKREYPFRDWISKHYETKYNAPADSVERGVSKLALNSGFGKTCQIIDGRPGKIWNPIYAATITGATRARMMEFNRLNGMKAVSFATDGIILEREDFKILPKRPAPAIHDLGEWENDGEGDAYILMSGVYSLWNPNGKMKTTFRGTAAYPFILHQRELKAEGRGHEASWPTFLEKYSHLSKVESSSVRPNSLKVARTMKKDFTAINIFEEHNFTLRAAGVSTKRQWVDRPSTFGDLLTNRYRLKPHNSVFTAFDAKEIFRMNRDE